MIRGFNNAVANNIIIGFKERRRRKKWNLRSAAGDFLMNLDAEMPWKYVSPEQSKCSNVLNFGLNPQISNYFP